MTNPPNEFAQQLDILFAELHNVLQNNLANKVTKDELNTVIGNIHEIETNVKTAIKHIQTLDERTQLLDTRLTKLQNYLQQAQQQQPTATPVMSTPQPQPQPVSTTSTTSGSAAVQIRIPKGQPYAGRPMVEDKTYEPEPLQVISSHPIIHKITSSQYYQESHRTAAELTNNTLKLINDENQLLLALQLCILIDLQNMHVFGYKDAELYKSHTDIIKAKITNKPVLQFMQVLEGYGLAQDELKYDLNMLKHVITNLANLSDADADRLIRGSYLCTIRKGEQQNLFQAFQNKMKQIINNATQQTETAVEAPTDHTPNQGS
jgi:hypothetical protein